MWVNYGRFMDNGRCGYILKPDIMMDPAFNPFDHSTYSSKVDGVTMTVQVLGARHLVKPVKGIVSPFVEIEIIGTENDSTRYKTKMCPDNGFNPTWMDVVSGRTQCTEVIEFRLGLPELACMRFTVYDEDVFGDANPIAQAVFPLGSQKDPCVRTGMLPLVFSASYNPFSAFSTFVSPVFFVLLYFVLSAMQINLRSLSYVLHASCPMLLIFHIDAL
jgi:phosphatidylinositol phospholipase C, gamma-1